MATTRRSETEAGTETTATAGKAQPVAENGSPSVDQFALDSDATIEDALRRARRHLGASTQHTNNADAALRRWQTLAKRAS